MDKWHNSNSLAGLPGMPKTVSGVVRKGKRENWLAHHSDGQGGVLAYHYNNLPEATQNALRQQQNASPVQSSSTEIVAADNEVKVDLTSLKKWQRDIFAARLTLYREFERLLELYGYSKAVAKLVARAKASSLPEHLQNMVAQANARKGKARTLSVSMVKGWHRKVKQNGITALAPKPARKNRVPDWAQYYHKVYNRPQKPSLSAALRELADILPDDMQLPSYHQVRRYHKNRSRLERERGRHSASALKRFKGYIRRSTDNLLPLDVVQCDGHSFKAKANHPVHGRPFKPEVCAVVDVKTKMGLGWSAGLAESAHTVADALRHSMTVNDDKPWGGLPAILYTDKGAGNMADMLGDEVTGVLARAGVTHHTGIPGNAQGRGLVEKTNQQLWISAAKKLETFVGSGMDELAKRNTYLLMEKEVRKTGSCRISELPSWANFLEICDQALRDYNNKPHGGLPKVRDAATQRVRHMTPNEAWFTAIREGWKPTLLDEAIIEDLYRPQVIRTTTRAQVSIFGNLYYDNILEHYHGEKIIVEYDIHKPESIRVRDMEQRLICVAQLDRNKKDFFPVSEVERCREKRAKGRLLRIDRKREEIEAERDGVVLDAGHSDLVIDADPEAVTRQLQVDNGLSGNINIIEHDPVSVVAPDLPQKQKPVKKPVQIVSTESERFNLLHQDLRTDPRPLQPDECEFLSAYYQKEGGRLYLKMVGDLRQEYGVADAEDQLSEAFK